jgi:RND family efflux transporter MFP subunit
MQERWFVTLGFMPMLIGVLALVLLRRPAETRMPVPLSAANEASRRKPVVDGAAAPSDEGFLGVVVAGHTADLGAQIGGSVVRVFVREGARVQAGEALVYIDPVTANSDARMAEAELAQQMSVVARAEAEHAQASDLLARLIAAGSGIPEQTVVTARAREAGSRAALDEALAGIDVGKARIHREQARIRKHTITAPFSGTVVMLGVDPGDVVSAGQLVARVISEEHDVRFAVPPSARSLAQVGAVVAVRLSGRAGQDVGGLAASGVVTELLPEVDAASGLLFVRARLELGAALAGAFVAGTTVRVSAVPGAKP